ncbi:hypothetical protein BX592_12988 [Paraburkholderia rhizosphaerae]|uniref:Uncharacterized protein n=1 Tax=Paraburkholderia rhizosphaerae TaxID=480658 RepID=A0A4R8L8D0_9BURK|nr:hypothetical protein [Paraburkholderia rhizosphaerae]TDY38971.1 hypothetical protein BX592_12988 [Paraburkholderia rhizosphaerae]
MAYSGLPVLEAVVGQQGILAVVIGNLVMSIVMIPLTLVLVQIGQGGNNDGQGTGALIAKSLLDAVKHPVVWLPLIGAILALCGVHAPSLFELSFNLIGNPRQAWRSPRWVCCFMDSACVSIALLR